MSIEKINSSLPTSAKIELLNDMIIELAGMVASGKFDLNELDNLYAQLAESGFSLDRKFLRNVLLGNTLLTYTDWSHLYSESGYSIWKLTPANYAYNALNKLYFDDRELDNRGEASSESLTSFDKVFLNGNESGNDFTDNTTEAASEDGTSFSLMSEIDDYLYVGGASTFSGIDFEFDSRGSNYTLVVEYYNGATWVAMTANANDLSDATQGFLGSGRITWTIPGSWATTSINSQTKYWIRISTTTLPTTTATAFLIVPTSSVIALLRLSSEEFFNEDYAWCYFSGSIYVTIKNTGVAAYEGDAFITSNSSAINKQNFFIYNHEYKSDYESSLYTGV